MIIRFDEELKVESVLAEDSINVGNNLTNEIKVFMPATFDINSHKGYVNFKLSDGKEYNNLVMERASKANETNSGELCYYYSLPKFLTKQKGPLYLSIRLSPINNTNVIANTGVIKTEVYYAIIDNGEEVIDPTTVEQIRKEIAESESALKLFVEETIKDGYDLRVVGTVDSVNDLPKNLTSSDVGESYYVGITYPRDVYTWGYLNNMELGWSNQGPVKILSDDPVLQFAKSEYDKTTNLVDIQKGGYGYLSADDNAIFDSVNSGQVIINKDTVTVTSSSNVWAGYVSEKIYVNSGDKYTLSYKSSVPISETGGGIMFFDKNGNYISEDFFDGSVYDTYYVSYKINVPSNASYFRFSLFLRGVKREIIFSEIMLNEGHVKLPYHQYCGEIIHEKDIRPTKLFEGASTENITLSDNIENYDYVTIFYDCGNGHSQSSITAECAILSTGGDICLMVPEIDSTLSDDYGFVTNYKTISIVGTSLMIVATGRWYRYQNGGEVNDQQNRIIIKRIFGHKEV